MANGPRPLTVLVLPVRAAGGGEGFAKSTAYVVPDTPLGTGAPGIEDITIGMAALVVLLSPNSEPQARTSATAATTVAAVIATSKRFIF